MLCSHKHTPLVGATAGTQTAGGGVGSEAGVLFLYLRGGIPYLGSEKANVTSPRTCKSSISRRPLAAAAAAREVEEVAVPFSTAGGLETLLSDAAGVQ